MIWPFHFYIFFSNTRESICLYKDYHRTFIHNDLKLESTPLLISRLCSKEKNEHGASKFQNDYIVGKIIKMKNSSSMILCMHSTLKMPTNLQWHKQSRVWWLGWKEYGKESQNDTNLRGDIFIMFMAMMVSENILAWYSLNIYSFCHNKYVFKVSQPSYFNHDVKN